MVCPIAHQVYNRDQVSDFQGYLQNQAFAHRVSDLREFCHQVFDLQEFHPNLVFSRA
jgi:hypothetical protein